MSKVLPSEFKNIIIRMPNWIGDFVMAMPLLREVARKYPKARLTILCKAPLNELILKDHNVDEVFVFNKSNSTVRRKSKKSIVEKLRLGQYDLGILTTNSFSSAWWFYQGKVKERIGFKSDMRSALLTKALSFPKNKEKIHLVDVYKKLLEPLGISNSLETPSLCLEETERQNAYDILKKYGVESSDVIIGINPGAAFGKAKCWPKERFQEVAKKLQLQDKIKVVFLETPIQKALSNQYVKIFQSQLVI